MPAFGRQDSQIFGELKSILVYIMNYILGVVVLCKVYTGVYLRKKRILADMEAIEANLSAQRGEDFQDSGQEQA